MYFVTENSLHTNIVLCSVNKKKKKKKTNKPKTNKDTQNHNQSHSYLPETNPSPQQFLTLLFIYSLQKGKFFGFYPSFYHFHGVYWPSTWVLATLFCLANRVLCFEFGCDGFHFLPFSCSLKRVVVLGWFGFLGQQGVSFVMLCLVVILLEGAPLLLSVVLNLSILMIFSSCKCIFFYEIIC